MPNAIVLSCHARKPVDGLIDNHRAYAATHGYLHLIEDGTHIHGERQVVLWKYHQIWRALTMCEPDGLVLFLDDFSLVYHRHPLERVAQGYDCIVTTRDKLSDDPTVSGLVARATPDVKERLRRVIHELSRWATYLPDAADAEEEILPRLAPPHVFTQALRSGYLSSVQVEWGRGRAFESLAAAKPLVVRHSPGWRKAGGRWIPTNADYDFRIVSGLVEDIRCIDSGVVPARLADFEQEAAKARDDVLIVNEDAGICFVTLHDNAVAGYGNIHEENFARYCARHGYGYRSYRRCPDWMPAGISRNWAKGHLVRRHLAQHEFVFWIDADIVSVNQRLGIDALIHGRDFIVGTDHTAWHLCSCLFGVRSNAAGTRIIEDFCVRVEGVPDKNDIYASNGDQGVLVDTLRHLGLLDANNIVDAISLASSPIYATAGSRFVHFPAQYNPYRALSMAIWHAKGGEG